MITINTPSLWPILLALVSALIGYQFNRRGREKDLFLDGITKSYKEVYYPMHKKLSEILQNENRDTQGLLLRDFFSQYSSINSEIKWMADFSLIKEYFEIEKCYQNLQPQQYDSFMKKLVDFSKCIEKESHDAHKMIYQNYKRSKKIMLANPAIRVLMEFIVLAFYICLFLIYLSLIYLFLSIINLIQPHPSYWFSIQLALVLLIFLMILLFIIIIPIYTIFFPEDDLFEPIKLFFNQLKIFFRRL